jgi:hypothetical protein
MPVTIPGRAIGNTKSNEMVLRPKNSYRVIAAAASDPKIKAMEVAISAVKNERITASRIPSLTAALLHHSVVNPVGGQAKDLLVLKEFMTTKRRGR